MTSVARRAPVGGRRAAHYRGRIAASPSHPSTGPTDDEVAVAEVIDEFYAAFEANDIDAMSDLWVHDDTVTCTHPGWAALHGWAAVSASWFAIFDQSPPMQVIITEERVRTVGDMAWVTVDENLLGAPGDDGGTTVAALKLLRRTPAGWRIVAHHGSVVAGRPE